MPHYGRFWKIVSQKRDICFDSTGASLRWVNGCNCHWFWKRSNCNHQFSLKTRVKRCFAHRRWNSQWLIRHPAPINWNSYWRPCVYRSWHSLAHTKLSNLLCVIQLQPRPQYILVSKQKEVNYFKRTQLILKDFSRRTEFTAVKWKLSPMDKNYLKCP